MNPSWMVALLIAVGLITWLVLFVNRRVEYTSNPWRSLLYRGDEPRALRALVGASLLAADVPRGNPEAEPRRVLFQQQVLPQIYFRWCKLLVLGRATACVCYCNRTTGW